MKDKPRELNESRLSGLIDVESEIRGDLTFKGSFRIEGYLKGTITSDALLIIGEKGKVEADVKVGQLVVNGEIRGTLQATDRIEIHEKGRVFGNVVAPKLVVEEGAYLEASCQTQSAPKQAPSKPKDAGGDQA